MTGVLRAAIVQQGAWQTRRPVMPLAAGYLKAAVESDPVTSGSVELAIVNLPGGADLRAAAVELFSQDAPDVLAFSVLGWNYRSFGELVRTYKQLRPDGLAVFGGNHVANQAARVMADYPVDVVVNGEGEQTFVELLRWRCAGAPHEELGEIAGISYRAAGRLAVDPVRTTADRERRRDLDALPSPFLTGALPLVDGSGRFLYDVALMETNRGCPYKCSFCYWGGAVGARVNEFSRDRLRAELELLGSHGVETVVLCDANFGMRSHDLDFVEDFIDVRNRLGAPRYLEASWAKNKSATFFEIVRLMRSEGLSSSFTLALQSLDEHTLATMARRNMQINDWRGVADFLRDEGLSCYAELIWGAPGETAASFFAGYDELAEVVPRIAVYPLLVIPNTDYDLRRDEYGLITVRGSDDDFEYVLSHDSMSAEENLDVQRVVFWARVLAENAFLRACWSALRLVPGVTQSQAVRAFADLVEASTTEVARSLRGWFRPFAESGAVVGALRELHAGADEARPLLLEWWTTAVVERAPAELAPFLSSVFDYDWLTRPVYVGAGSPDPLPVESIGGERYYVHPQHRFDHDVPGWLAGGSGGVDPSTTCPRVVEIVAKVGFGDFLENHEVAIHFAGRERSTVWAGTADHRTA